VQNQTLVVPILLAALNVSRVQSHAYAQCTDFLRPRFYSQRLLRRNSTGECTGCCGKSHHETISTFCEFLPSVTGELRPQQLMVPLPRRAVGLRHLLQQACAALDVTHQEGHCGRTREGRTGERAAAGSMPDARRRRLRLKRLRRRCSR
jgi:hypothetical protein